MKIYNRLQDIPIKWEHIKKTPSRKRVKYYDIIVSFDIETYNFIDDTGNNAAIMYCWQMCIDGYYIMGRTWDEYINVLRDISKRLDLNEKNRVIIWVHNLSFEFGFLKNKIQNLWGWKNIFAIEPRKPIYAIDNAGFEYRCSYLLSGYSLANCAKNLVHYKIHKLKMQDGYDKPRHPETPLTKREIIYCKRDVEIVYKYISERREIDGGLHKIPLTKTGYVRQFVRGKMFNSDNRRVNNTMHRIMKSLQLTPAEYQQIHGAFMGGYTHANPLKSLRVYNDVTSYDFTSSYPAVMVSEMFPMSSPYKDSNIYYNNDAITHIHELSTKYCVCFRISFRHIQSTAPDDYLSVSRCTVGDGERIIDNGRVFYAEMLSTYITDVDYTIIEQCYQWDKCIVQDIMYFRRGYLPKPIVESVFELYGKKTKLKGVDGMEVEYLSSKEMVNSLYGMCVTAIDKDVYNLDDMGEWQTQPKDIDEIFEKYNNNYNRAIYYPWGVWVTAYARRNLWMGILECGDDYIYSDTDSIKILHADKHQNFIEQYNQWVTDKIQTVCEYYWIDPEQAAPKTIKGVSKPLGVWDFDGKYTRFKTLGAKRYMVEYPTGEVSLTVSGINKRLAIPYLQEQCQAGTDIFELFSNGLYLPPEHSGKTVVQYHDEQIEGLIYDYNNTPYIYEENGYTYLTSTYYNMGLNEYEGFVDYILERLDTAGGI